MHKRGNDNVNPSDQKHSIPRCLCLHFQGDNLSKWSSICSDFLVAEDSSLSFSSNLVNLETLIVKGLGGRVTLPDTLWKMVKLRHLHIYSHVVFNINNSLQKLDDLRILSLAWFSCTEDMNKVFEKMQIFRN
ncbi:hypothetical protein P3S67_015346 [Capsicum chacoense]